MTDEPKFIPCPFCGNANIDGYYNSSTHSYYVWCHYCGASTRGMSDDEHNEAEATAAWNKRAATPPVQP